jgi:hypothetical protein
MGKIERAVLCSIIGANLSEEAVRRDDVTASVYKVDIGEPTRAQVSSVNRAIRALKRKGYVNESDFYPHGHLMFEGMIPEAKAALRLLREGKPVPVPGRQPYETNSNHS